MNPAEIERLERKHSDIRLHGAGVIAIQATKDRKQDDMQSFVDLHGLKCFKCGSGFNAWAKCSTTNGRAWAICSVCVRKKATPPKGAA